jgi:uncharacterized membrane protein YkvI
MGWIIAFMVVVFIIVAGTFSSGTTGSDTTVQQPAGSSWDSQRWQEFENYADQRCAEEPSHPSC